MGEAEADKANRAALTSLIHRNRALSDEYARWVSNNEIGSTVSYGQLFEQYDKFKAAKESLQADVRKIVPTPRYDCLLSLASRSIDADIALMNARESYYRHRLAFNSANDLTARYIAEARNSEYGKETYLQSAREQVEEMKKERDQFVEFSRVSNKNASAATRLGDSLVASVLSFRLLPSMERPRYPILTDSGPDSLTHPNAALINFACKNK